MSMHWNASNLSFKCIQFLLGILLYFSSIISYEMTLQQEKLTMINEIFSILDELGKGSINYDDFKELLNRVSIFPSDFELQKLFLAIEKDGYVKLKNIIES